MNTIFIGSNNAHKLQEIKDIFALNNISFNILCPKDIGLLQEPVEDGKTFAENATIKSKFFYEHSKMPTISEDSGICIEFYDGGPGIYSKRFLGGLNDHDKNEEILKQMKGSDKRKATFYTVISFIDEKGMNYLFEGTNEGRIALSQSGTAGFGYDPIFYVPSEGKTESELGQAWKNKNSHRAVAFKKFIDFYRENYND